MQSLTKVNDPDSHRLMKVLAVAVIVLIFSAATAIGDLSVQTESTTDIEIDDTESNDSRESSQSVTMKIDVDEDDVLDLGMAQGDVVVDTWDGEDVLVIVEKNAMPAPQLSHETRSLSIKVTRHGNNVHIATLDNWGHPFNDPSLSLRIMVPKRHAAPENVSSIYDLSKLTSVVFKALRGEALKWIGR